MYIIPAAVLCSAECVTLKVPAQGVHRFEGDILAFKEHLRKTHAALADK